MIIIAKTEVSDEQESGHARLVQRVESNDG